MTRNHPSPNFVSSPLSPAQSYYKLGKVLAQQQRWEEATRAYQQSLRLDPQLQSASQALAELQAQQNGKQDSEQLSSSVLESNENGSKNGSFSQVLDPTLLVDRQTSNSHLESSSVVKNYLKQAETYCERQEWQAAIDVCHQTLNLQPDNAEVFVLLGNALYGKRDLEKAKQAYIKALEIQPVLANTQANLGSLYAELEQLEKAISCYQKATELKPNFPRAYRNWGRIYQQLGRRSEALDCWYRAFQLAPRESTPEQHLNLGNTLWKQEQPEAAIQCYRTAIELDPKYVPAYQNLGTALVKQKQWKEAILAYRQALELEPNSIKVRSQLGKALYYQSRTYLNESIELYAGAIATKPYEVDLYHGALEVEPYNARLYFGLGKALEERGEIAQAIVFYNLALQQDPARVDEATAAYHRVISTSKNSPTIERKLSEAYANIGQICLEKSLESYQNALQLDADNPQLYYQILEANISNAKLYFGLADSLKMRGNTQGAIAFYQKGLKLDPDNVAMSAKLRSLLQPDRTSGDFASDHFEVPRNPVTNLPFLSEDLLADFNLEFYVEYNPDLAHLSSPQEIEKHWIEYGKFEGRIGSEKQFYELHGLNPQALPIEFDWKAYLELNPDLQGHLQSKWSAIQHFLVHGEKEGRLYSFDQLYYQPKPDSETVQVTGESHTAREKDEELAFDWTFYLDYNEDLTNIASYEEAYDHWLNYGKAEGRIASEEQFYQAHGIQKSDIPIDFDWQGYLDLHLDLKENINSKWKAISHYLTIGWTEKRIYSLDQLHKGSQVAQKSIAQFDDTPEKSTGVQRLAVLFHLYYFDLWDEIREYIRNIEEEFDFYVNIVESIWTPEIHDRIRQDFPQARIQISQNRGKDIGGHLASMDLIDFSQYDVFCLIHTKKSPHVSHLISDQWRRDLYEAILGSPEKVKTNLEIIRKDASAGLIGSRYWRNTDVLNNSDHYDKLLDVFEIKSEARTCEYLSGTMMLVRPMIWQTIYDKFRNDDLEAGDGKDLDFQKDGQIAHALERIIGNLVRHHGMRLFWQE
ncbi:MAG: tetratricopeptide repeat protein [Geitlerinemataceae cyanobacterium]